MAGMVGRIVVAPEGADLDAIREPGGSAGGSKQPSPAALAAFPPIASILQRGAVRL
jgi:hypothetical protein